MAKLGSHEVRTGRSRTLPIAARTAAAEVHPEQAKHAAQRDIESKLKAAFEQARTEGLARGKEAADAEFQQRWTAAQQELQRERSALIEAGAQRRQLLEAQLEALRAHQQQLEQEAVALAVELAFRAATRLLHVRLEDRALLAEASNVALQELGSAVIRVRVPQAASEVMQFTEKSGVEVVIDASLKPDQCFIETTRGESETGLATRLEGIKNALLCAINEGVNDRA